MDVIRKFLAATCLVAIFSVSSIANAATVHLTDFINDSTRSNFMGFESLPNTGFYGATYSENGISIEQVNGDLNDIWTGNPWNGSTRSWYPNGGDSGYTKLTLAGGDSFDNIGFQYKENHYCGSSCFSGLYYELYNSGSMIQSGDFPAVQGGDIGYLGFSGGGFDEVHVWTGGAVNALSLDDIEIAAVPVPAAAWLFGSGLLGLIGVARRKVRV